MNKTELLEMALEKLTAASNYIDTLGGVSKGYRMDIERLKAALEAKDEPIGSFMTRLQAIDFLLKMRPQTEPTEKQIIATIDAYSALFGDMIESPVLPKQEAKDEPWEEFCDSHCVWTDHHPDCKLAQRTWVDLTDKYWKRNKHSADFQKGVDWAEAMLKGKNT